MATSDMLPLRETVKWNIVNRGGSRSLFRLFIMAWLKPVNLLQQSLSHQVIIIFKGTPHNQRTPPIIKKRKRNAQNPFSITIDRSLRHFIGLPLNWVQNSVVLNPPRAGFIRVSRYQTNTIQSAAQNSPM